MPVALSTLEALARQSDFLPRTSVAAPRERQMSLAVVVPVYNERPTIEEALRRVQATGLPDEIILVDDCSTDGTREFLRSLESLKQSGSRDVEILGGAARLSLAPLSFLYQERNRGKGAAVRRGLHAASSDILLIQDADLEYDPHDYPRLLEPILDGRADAVFGSRFLGGPQRVHLFWHYVGNRFLTLLSDMLTNLKISDIETCYKVFRREVLDGVTLRSNRFGFEPEVTAKIARGGWRVFEVPISYYGRSYLEGKKITWKDGVAALFAILRYSVFD